MMVLVVGASGATGKLLVQSLLNRGLDVKVVVRSSDRLPDEIRYHERLSVIEASVLALSDAELAGYVKGCTAIASCLGHNLSWKGIYGKPRKLVTEATRRLCEAIKMNKPEGPVKFVLMNTAGNRNRDLDEQVSLGEILLIGLIRFLIPPHVDNEMAANFLRVSIGQNNKAIEWVAVRPDTLIDEGTASSYEVQPSPTRSAIFNPGKTSRINVGDFMASLITDRELWREWQGRMPVIYNTTKDGGN